MNNLTIKQISGILNAWAKENFYNDGTKPFTAELNSENLSNIADFGHNLLTDNDINKVMSAVGDIVSRVTNTIMLNAKYISTAPKVFVDAVTYGGLTEVIKVNGTEFEDSLVFDIVTDDISRFYKNTNTFDKLFGKKIPNVTAKYFDKILPYQQKITVDKKQFTQALGDATLMTKLFSSWENQINIAKQYAIDVLNYIAFDALLLTVAENRANESVVKTNRTSLVDTAKQFKNIIREFKTYNSKYADDFVTSLDSGDISVICSAEFYDYITTDRANIYNPDFLNIPIERITDIPYFQCADEPNKVKGIVNETPTGKLSVLNNIDFVIYDKRAVATTFTDESVEHQYIANERATNVFHMGAQSMIVLPELAVCIGTKNGSADFTHIDIE